jgi:acyl carrier protein
VRCAHPVPGPRLPQTLSLIMSAVCSVVRSVVVVTVCFYLGSVFAQSESEISLVRAVVAKELGIPVESVETASTLAKQMRAADSLNVVEIVLELERRTGKEITDAALEQVVGKYSMKKIAEQVTVIDLAHVLAIAPRAKK